MATKIEYGLYIGHGVGIVINGGTTIGNNVCIGPNVCIVEEVKNGSDTTIAAGSIVVREIQQS